MLHSTPVRALLPQAWSASGGLRHRIGLIIWSTVTNLRFARRTTVNTLTARKGYPDSMETVQALHGLSI